MFTSDLGNIFTSASANMLTSASANIFTSDLANTFTSDLANMFTSKLEKYKKWFGQHVPWWNWLVNMLALYQEYDTWSETVYILGNSMVKKLNGFLLTWKLNQKCLVKFDSLIRPRWDACTTMRNQLFEILTWTTLYYIVWLLVEHPVRSLEIIHPARSLKSDKNKISISLLRPRSGKLNNKASEVNNCLMNTCSNQNIAYIGRSISAHQNYINTHSKIWTDTGQQFSRTLSLSFSQNTVDGIMIIEIKFN